LLKNLGKFGLKLGKVGRPLGKRKELRIRLTNSSKKGLAF